MWDVLFTRLQRLSFLIPIWTYSLQNPRQGLADITLYFYVAFVKFKPKLSSSHVNDKHVSSYQNSGYLIRVRKLFYTKNWSLSIWNNAEWCVWFDIPPKRPNKLVVLHVVKKRKPSFRQNILWKQEKRLQSNIPASRLLHGYKVHSVVCISFDHAVSDREIYRNEWLWIVSYKGLGEMKNTMDKEAHFLYIRLRILTK